MKGLHKGCIRKVDNPMKWMEEDKSHFEIKEELQKFLSENDYILNLVGAENESTLLLVAEHFANWNKIQGDDLEKEIEKVWEAFPPKFLDYTAFAELVTHFYELGCRHAAAEYDDIEYERQRREALEPTVRGWVARDKMGNLNFFLGEPRRFTNTRGEEYWIGHARMKAPNELFHDLKWEDNPLECELTINRI